MCRDVFFGVERQARKRKIRASSGADFRGIFANAAGEDEGVGPIQYGKHGADASAQPMYKHMERKLGSLVTVLHRRDNFAHVGSYPGNSQKTGFRVQQIIDRFSVQFFFAHQISKDAGINGAGAGAHHESVERSESHGGVDAFSAANCSKRAAVAKMTSNQLKIGQLFLENPSRALRTVLMIDTVKTEFSNSLLHPVIWTRINRGGIG